MLCVSFLILLLCVWYDDRRELHERTHASPTRRSAELVAYLHAERPVRPVGEAERRRGPAVPVGAAGNDVDLQSDAGRANHFGNRLARSEEHTSEIQFLLRISYAVFCF